MYKHDTVSSHVQPSNCEKTEMLLMKLCWFFFSLLSGKREHKNFSFMHTHIFVPDEHKRHINSSQAQGGFICSLQRIVGECSAALVVSALCMWLCVQRKAKEKMAACQSTMCVYVSEMCRKTNRHVWCVCISYSPAKVC